MLEDSEDAYGGCGVGIVDLLLLVPFETIWMGFCFALFGLSLGGRAFGGFYVPVEIAWFSPSSVSYINASMHEAESFHLNLEPCPTFFTHISITSRYQTETV